MTEKDGTGKNGRNGRNGRTVDMETGDETETKKPLPRVGMDRHRDDNGWI